MEIEIETRVLRRALEKTFSVTTQKAIMPVLRNVFCEVDESGVSFTGSDSTLAVTTHLDFANTGTVLIDEGSCLLPPSLLPIVKKLPGAQTYLRARDRLLNVVSPPNGEGYGAALKLDQGRYRLYDAPMESHGYATLQTLLSALSIVRPALAAESLRELFSCVVVRDGRMFATDGVRFIMVEALSLPDMTLPLAVVDTILRIAAKSPDETVQIFVGNTAYRLVIGNDVITAGRPTQETFSDMHIYLPDMAQRATVFEFERRELLAMVDRVLLTSDYDTRLLVLSAWDGRLSAMCDSAYGTASEDLLLCGETEEHLSASVDGTALRDILAALPDKQIMVQFTRNRGGRYGPLCISTPKASATIQQLRVGRKKEVLMT